MSFRLSCLGICSIFFFLGACTKKSASTPGTSAVASEVTAAIASDLKSRLQTDGIPDADVTAIIAGVNGASSASGVVVGRFAKARIQAFSVSSDGVNAFASIAANVAGIVASSTDLSADQAAQVVNDLDTSAVYVLAQRAPSGTDQQAIMTVALSAFPAAGVPTTTVIANLSTIAQSLMTAQIAGASASAVNQAAENFSAALPAALSVAGVSSDLVQSGVESLTRGFCNAAGAAKLTASSATSFQVSLVAGMTAAAASLSGVTSSSTTFAAYLSTVKTGIVAGFGSADDAAIAAGVSATATSAGISSDVADNAKQAVASFNPSNTKPASFTAELPKTKPPTAPGDGDGYVSVATAYISGANVITLTILGSVTCATDACSIAVTFKSTAGDQLDNKTYTKSDVSAHTALLPVGVLTSPVFTMQVSETLDGGKKLSFVAPGFILSSGTVAIATPTPAPSQGGADYQSGSVQGVPTASPLPLPASGGSVTFSSISPTSGTTLGGTSVTITGSGFTAGMIAVLGGVPCAGVNVTSSTTLTCTTGPHGAEQVTLILGSSTGQASAENAFTYVLVSNVSGGDGGSSGGSDGTSSGGTVAGAGSSWTPFNGSLTLSGHDAQPLDGLDAASHYPTGASGLFGCSAISPGGDLYVITTKNALEINSTRYEQNAILHIRPAGAASFDPVLTQDIDNNLGPCNIYFDGGTVYVNAESMGGSLVYTNTEARALATTNTFTAHSWGYYGSAPACDPSNFQVVAWQNTFMTKNGSNWNTYFLYQLFNFVVGGGQGVSVSFDYAHQSNGAWLDDGPHYPTGNSGIYAYNGMQGAYQNGQNVLIVATNLFRSTDGGNQFSQITSATNSAVAATQNASDGSVLIASTVSSDKSMIITGTRDTGATFTDLYKFASVTPARAVMAATQNTVYLFYSTVTSVTFPANMEWDNDSAIWETHSNDEGLTWSTPTQVIDVRDLSNTGASWNGIGAFHAFASSGRVVLVYGVVNGPNWLPQTNYGTYVKEYY